MRHGPDVPNALTYAQRRRRHLCTTPGCKHKAVRRRTMCDQHLSKLRDYHNARNRAKGMRSRAEYLQERKQKTGRITDQELLEIIPCACGLRHKPPCDLEQRRQEIRTAGMGTWAI